MADGAATGGPARPTSEKVGYVELSRAGRELGAQRRLPRARSLLLAPKLVRSSSDASCAAPAHHDLNPDDRRSKNASLGPRSRSLRVRDRVRAAHVGRRAAQDQLAAAR
jgi:hypothetical protein